MCRELQPSRQTYFSHVRSIELLVKWNFPPGKFLRSLGRRPACLLLRTQHRSRVGHMLTPRCVRHWLHGARRAAHGAAIAVDTTRMLAPWTLPGAGDAFWLSLLVLRSRCCGWQPRRTGECTRSAIISWQQLPLRRRWRMHTPVPHECGSAFNSASAQPSGDAADVLRSAWAGVDVYLRGG